MTKDPSGKLSEKLKDLVRQKRTGLLEIKGAQGFEARIFLENGGLVVVEDGKLYGAPAAKHIAKRICLAAAFHEGRAPSKKVSMRFTTAECIGLMEKAEKAFETCARVVPTLDAVFVLNRDSWGKEEVNPKDLQILLCLDGRRTVREAVQESGLPELDVLHTIYRYHGRGLLRRLSGAKPMPTDRCRRLLADLQEQLAELIGPAAEAIIEEAFQTVNISPDHLSQAELPLLLDSVHRHLDEQESSALQSWAVANGYAAA